MRQLRCSKMDGPRFCGRLSIVLLYLPLELFASCQENNSSMSIRPANMTTRLSTHKGLS